MSKTEEEGSPKGGPNSSATKAFLKGIEKLCSAQQMNITIDKKAKKHLATQLSQILTKIAIKASETSSKAEMLQPNHIQEALNSVMGSIMLRAATGEGARCLTLYGNGMIKFSAVTKKKVSTKGLKIDGKHFSQGLKGFYTEFVSEGEMNSNLRKAIQDILAETANYISSTAGNMCRYQNRTEMGSEEIAEALKSIISDSELRRHALSQGSDYVTKFVHGLITFEKPSKVEREPSKKKKKVGVLKKSKRTVVKKKAIRRETPSKRKPAVKKKPAAKKKAIRRKTPSKKMPAVKTKKIRRRTPPRKKSVMKKKAIRRKTPPKKMPVVKTKKIRRRTPPRKKSVTKKKAIRRKTPPKPMPVVKKKRIRKRTPSRKKPAPKKKAIRRKTPSKKRPTAGKKIVRRVISVGKKALPKRKKSVKRAKKPKKPKTPKISGEVAPARRKRKPSPKRKVTAKKRKAVELEGPPSKKRKRISRRKTPTRKTVKRKASPTPTRPKKKLKSKPPSKRKSKSPKRAKTPPKKRKKTVKTAAKTAARKGKKRKTTPEVTKMTKASKKEELLFSSAIESLGNLILYRISGHLHPETSKGISGIVADVAMHLALESANDAQKSGRKELGVQNIINATTRVFPRELARHALSRGEVELSDNDSE